MGRALLRWLDRVVASTSLRSLKKGHKVDLPPKAAIQPTAPGASAPTTR